MYLALRQHSALEFFFPCGKSAAHAYIQDSKYFDREIDRIGIRCWTAAPDTGLHGTMRIAGIHFKVYYILKN